MSENLIILIALLSPAAFVITAIASWFQQGFKPKLIIVLSTIATILSLTIAAFSGLIVYENGLIESGLIGIKDLGFSIRLDSLSVLMLGMITLLGFIIIRFSINYLDGDQRQGTFIGRLAATIASVQLLVLSGNLGLLFVTWVLTSLSLHRLLVFYRERRGAQIAAKKKFILARLGDACLLIAVILLYSQFGSGNLEDIFNAVSEGSRADLPLMALEAPALFLVLAALLKSAQFPTHGWLIEVMETPTPVSALLHAGLLNAGPFLIIRMAHVMEVSTLAPVMLITIGGFTALFGSVVYLTQTSIKTALGYSSVAHMGFSLMVCGLGVYSAAMLHLVAHSFYKAHAFLSSGSVIDVLRGSKMAKLTRTGSPLKIVLGIVMALALYTGFSLAWGMDLKNDVSLLVIGAIIVMGLSRIFVSAIDSKGSSAIILQSTLLALLVTVAFFTLESGTRHLLSSQLPAYTMPGLGKIIATSIILLAFSLAVFVQLIAPQLSKKPYCLNMAIHIRNGFYANTVFDKLVGTLRIHSTDNKQTLDNQVSRNTKYETAGIDDLQLRLEEYERVWQNKI